MLGIAHRTVRRKTLFFDLSSVNKHWEIVHSEIFLFEKFSAKRGVLIGGRVINGIPPVML